MSNIKKRVAILPWPNKENCFLVLSGAIKQKTRYGDKWYINSHDEREQKYESDKTLDAKITFAYRDSGIAAEWDGEYGPIQIWYECDKDWKDGFDEAREHWLFEYAYGSGCWSQIAVDENNLVEAFNTGDYDHIFSILKRFVDGRKNKGE